MGTNLMLKYGLCEYLKKKKTQLTTCRLIAPKHLGGLPLQSALFHNHGVGYRVYTMTEFGTTQCLNGNVVLTLSQPQNRHYFVTRKCLKTPYHGPQYSMLQLVPEIYLSSTGC